MFLNTSSIGLKKVNKFTELLETQNKKNIAIIITVTAAGDFAPHLNVFKYDGQLIIISTLQQEKYTHFYVVSEMEKYLVILFVVFVLFVEYPLLLFFFRFNSKYTCFPNVKVFFCISSTVAKTRGN